MAGKKKTAEAPALTVEERLAAIETWAKAISAKLSSHGVHHPHPGAEPEAEPEEESKE